MQQSLQSNCRSFHHLSWKEWHGCAEMGGIVGGHLYIFISIKKQWYDDREGSSGCIAETRKGHGLKLGTLNYCILCTGFNFFHNKKIWNILWVFIVKYYLGHVSLGNPHVPPMVWLLQFENYNLECHPFKSIRAVPLQVLPGVYTFENCVVIYLFTDK